jgi:sensor domain CHASE-containing protein/nitrogen-specific signal transduction histidine kinase
LKIRTRSRIILIGTIVVFLLVLSYITQSVIIESFGAIERQEATANMQRVLSSLNDQVEQVAAQCRGRAEWDDTYRFIDDKTPGYIQSNLASPTTFTNLGINYMLFYNESGSLVYAKGYDIENGAELPITDDLTALVKNSIIPEGMPGGVSGRRGFSLLDGQPVIIVGYGITTTNMTSPARGTLVMVRKFDADRLNYVAQQTQLAIKFQALGKTVAPSGIVETDWERIIGGAIITKPANDTVMTGFTVITGIENKPSMILISVETSRPVYWQVQQSILIMAAAIILLSIFLILVVQMLLQRFLLAPLSTLDNDIKVIGRSKNLSHRIPVKGDEEIASMTRSLNNMLAVIGKQRDDINSARQDLSNRNDELAKLVEKVQQQRDELDNAREDLADRNKNLEDLLEEIRQQRDALQDARAELADRNHDLEEFNRKANLYLDIYLDVLTYEILNSIMGLRGYAEFLSETGGEKERVLAEKIIALAKKSDDVIRNIETISRIYKTPPKVYPVNLKKFMEQEISVWKGVNIQVENSDFTVLANNMLGAIFDNIFSNSLKYGGRDVQIHVDAIKTGQGMVEISIADNGPGISNEMKPQVFDRFLKDSTTRSSYGLGLHIVKMLVESYGGKVWADDRIPGNVRAGAAIRFRLHLVNELHI